VPRTGGRDYICSQGRCIDKTALAYAAELDYREYMLLVLAKAGSCDPPRSPPHPRSSRCDVDAVLVVELIPWLSTLNISHGLYVDYFPGSSGGA
jgi:hypothetical protein